MPLSRTVSPSPAVGCVKIPPRSAAYGMRLIMATWTAIMSSLASAPAAAQVRKYLAAQTWVYARTMPKWPHEYVLLKRATDPWLHLRVVAYVRQRGEHRYFAPSRRVHSYWQAGDGWEYWTMRAADTILNRRAQVQPA